MRTRASRAARRSGASYWSLSSGPLVWVAAGVGQQALLRRRVLADRHLRLERALALLVGEPAVDNAVRRLRQPVGHRVVLAGRPRDIAAVQQLVGECDAEGRPGLVDDAVLAEHVDHLG